MSSKYRITERQNVRGFDVEKWAPRLFGLFGGRWRFVAHYYAKQHAEMAVGLMINPRQANVTTGDNSPAARVSGADPVQAHPKKV